MQKTFLSTKQKFALSDSSTEKERILGIFFPQSIKAFLKILINMKKLFFKTVM